MSLTSAAGRLTAVLGPTNTGKTYLAIERMLGHESGMIGFPLRLLARENYDRIVKIKGASQVALITGEEKIAPPSARYFVCTVESMPLDRTVSFLAVDEVQMAADPERGHFFTDRILHARGTHETMLLGADTIRPVLNRLLPDIDVVARPRFSKLAYVGPKKATRLPRRSAVVGFSASEVYAIAELIRRQRGGTAIVMGALSPRTRNAQVDMFQSGEVDYLVATDAIGMGLNMDVNHVWFASLRKYDGRTLRPLRSVELAQIAGRAGRHMNDGTFGTTAEVGGLEPEMVEAIENHRFDPLRDVQWRNSDLHFHSVPALIASLNRPPHHAALQRVREQDDQIALQTLSTHSDFLPRLRTPQRVKLLWEVCQVPDFRKTMTEEHTRLLAQLFEHLTQGGERLPEDWIESHIKRLEHYDGDIDTLMARIAHVRTWTYISHRPDWIQRSVHWQERTRTIEDKLSDVLHQRLTQRFVDRRAALLVRRLRDEGEMTSSVAAAGEVSVEGEHLGRIEGFRFVPDTTEGQTDQKAVLSAALRALRQDLPARLQAFANSPDGELVFDSQLRVCWGGGPGRAPAAERRHPGAQGRSAAVRPSRRTGARGSAQARRHLGRDAHSPWPQRVDGCPCHGGTAGRRARHHLPALRGSGRAGAPADRGAAHPAERGGSQGVGAARRAGRRLFALLPEHAEAGADPAARRALDGGEQPRDHSAAAGRRPHLDGPAARRAARFLRHDRLSAAGRPRHPRRHGRAPGSDGAPCRA